MVRPNLLSDSVTVLRLAKVCDVRRWKVSQPQDQSAVGTLFYVQLLIGKGLIMVTGRVALLTMASEFDTFSLA